ncbi:MAG: hypothetical protein WBG86_19105 [Polyangiales bacterium]
MSFMTKVNITVLGLLCASWLWGCSDAGAGQSCDESGACAASRETALCGEGGAGFLVWTGGGQLSSILQTELGHRYIVVDTSCRFVVYDMVTPSIGVAVQGTLTPEQADELSDFLALEEWYELAPGYGPCGVLDAGGTTMKWSDRTVTLGGGSGVDCAERPSDFRHDLDRVPSELASHLEALGTPVSGAVRYVLVPSDSNGETYPDNPSYANAPEWPLDIPIEVASMPGEDGAGFLGWEHVRVMVADGDDARALRDLRTAFLDGQVGQPRAWSIPIEQPDGSRYQLELRDVVEFELDGQPVVPWLATGDLSITTLAPPSVMGISFSVFCEGASDPVADGASEVFHGASGGTQYWGGEATELPQGFCQVVHVATTAEGELRCGPFENVGEAGAISIRAGWTTYASFTCER